MWWLTPFFRHTKTARVLLQPHLFCCAFFLLIIVHFLTWLQFMVPTITTITPADYQTAASRFFYARRCVKRGITSKFWIIFFLRSRPEVSNIWRDTTQIRCLYELQNTERQHTGADTDRVTVRLLRQHSPWRFIETYWKDSTVVVKKATAECLYILAHFTTPILAKGISL